ncbi:sodium-dependent bicarbonate transport family permease [Kamptonema cortianum]|nr:sodium-dependent bicarbonate transport family permease [Kamptonema cortianum]
MTPLIAFYLARIRLNRPNAAAIAATYGSVSAVTFITATSFLDSLKTGYSGYMVAALAIMESPAIIAGIMLAKGGGGAQGKKIEYKKLFHEAFLNSSVLLLLGSMVIGFFSASHTIGKMLPFTQEIFYGVLCFFLLEMGIVASKRLDALKQAGIFPIVLAIVIPLINAALAVIFCVIFKIGGGNAFLFITLAASASYIAVPAAMRLALPEANPSFYVPMALALTFPFNITIGMALYYHISTLL